MKHIRIEGITIDRYCARNVGYGSQVKSIAGAERERETINDSSPRLAVPMQA
jgi:hypothetical protein